MAKNTRKAAATATKITPAALVAAAATGTERRIVPLGGGTYAYVHDPVTRRSIHVKVDSEAFDTTIATQSAHDTAYAARLERELSELEIGDFPAALARLRAAETFSAG